jgi:putative hydrolase of the HAD superfamily
LKVKDTDFRLLAVDLDGVVVRPLERVRREPLTENLGLGKIFESFVWSGDIGVTKSEVAFFAAALPRIGLDSPASVLFIDDDRGNVETARAAGWTAHHYTGIDDLRRILGTGR